MQRITDQFGNSWLYEPNTGDTYQEYGLNGIFDEIGNIFKPKAGGTAVGNLFRRATSRKNVQALVSKGAQSVTNRLIQGRNRYTGGAAPTTLPYPTYTQPGSAGNTSQPPTLPEKDNTMLYVVGGLGVLAVVTIAVVAGKSGKKGKGSQQLNGLGTIKTIDNTYGAKPKKDKVFSLSVEYHNGERYVYYGKTKKEALNNFKKKWGTFKGFVKKEWEIEDD